MKLCRLWYYRVRLTITYIITLIKTHRLLYENLIVLHLNKLEFPSSKDALCQVWLKLAQLFLRRWFLHLSMYFQYFVIISPGKKMGPLIWTNLSPHHPRIYCAKFDWNWSSGSGEIFFLISSMFFRYFVIISPWKRTGPFIWTNMNSLYPRMVCAKFGWNWPRGSWEEVENRKRLQTDGQTRDDRRSEKLTLALSSGKLIKKGILVRKQNFNPLIQ